MIPKITNADIEHKFKDIYEKQIFEYIDQNTFFKEKIKNLLNQKKGIPLTLLHIKKLSNLEAIVKYLRENEELSYKQIGTKLNRNPKTLAVIYKKAKEKQITKLPNFYDDEIIPFAVFTENLSVLESIVNYFLHCGKKQAQIARIMKRDARTIGTVACRLKQKQNLKQKHEKNQKK